MQVHRNRQRASESGSALIISLVIILVLGLALGSYLSLVSAQNKSVMRSLSWNSAIPSMEAGVEEALVHLHYRGITNLANDGWALASDGWYQKSGNLGGGFGYVTRIQPVEPPRILSTGVAPTPTGPALIETEVGAVLRAVKDQENFVRRSVAVPTRRDRIFTHAMVAKRDIDLAGKNIATDSFDSLDPLHSTGGLYDPAKHKESGDVATNGRIGSSLDIGNATIMGKIATGPGGSVEMTAHGSVGDASWVDSGRTGIQDGHSSEDMNVSFPDAQSPFTTGMIPPSAEIAGTRYDHVLGDGDYVLSEMTGNVLVTGNARIYVSSSLKISGEDQLKIAPKASLKMFVAAPKVSLGGQGVANDTGNALNFQYWGLPTNTSIALGGNAAFVGAIYAPQAEFHLGGGGKDTYDFVGSCVVDSVRMNGNFHFHYDEALRRIGPDRGYVADGWSEISPLEALPLLAVGGVY